VAIPEFRFHNYTVATPEVNFNNGNVADWIWVADPVAHGGEFYSPVISDPVVSKTMFAGTSRTAYRTKTAGLGTMTMTQAQQHCNTWNGDFAVQCGDWAELGPRRLTSADWGDRPGGNVAAVERTAADTSTAWAATNLGRVFVTKNVDAEGIDEFPATPPSTNTRRVATNVVWTRIDQPATPGRFVSSIHVDPTDGNHAWVSYSGYNVNTPTTPGHVFEVRFNPATGTATWTNLDHNLADLPITDLVRDDRSGDLFAATDFGALRLAAGSTTWRLAARGMPNVEIAGLTILAGERKLFAATHGLSAWLLDLEDLDDGDEDEDDDDDDD
jgi:hypothetical protein